jgi:hypothetical protein
MDSDVTVDAMGLPIRSQPDGSDVRKTIAAELAGVVEAVALSFYEDPIFRWIVPDDRRRARARAGVWPVRAPCLVPS